MRTDDATQFGPQRGRPHSRTKTGLLKFAFACGLANAAQLIAASVDESKTEQPTRLYLANDDHTDYMWSADAATYDRTFVEMLDFHLALADRTAGNLPNFRNRFNADGSYWLWSYERQKTPAEFARLIERVKDGTISVPLNTLVSCYGAQPLEAVLRGLYYAGRLERRYQLRFLLASATENQTLPRGLSSIFAGAGAAYSWRGVCGCASLLSRDVLGARPHEMYWYTGPDGRRVVMKWYSLGPHQLGTYVEAGSPEKAIDYISANTGFSQRNSDPVSHLPYKVIGLFGFGGDDLGRKTGVPPALEIPAVPSFQKVVSGPQTDDFHVIAQRKTTAERSVIVSNEIDFFADFSEHYAATLPTESVTYGNEWDLYSASMAETSAKVKRSVEKLRTAELLSSLVSLAYPPFLDAYTDDRDRAFADLGLYWEHDWTADGHVSRERRAAWQELLASRISYYVDSLHAEGLLRLGGLIPRPNKEANRFFVLNPLGWARTDYADFLYTGSHEIRVRDLSANADVPFQFVSRRGISHLRILATAVPSAGYKVFEIQKGPSAAPTDPAATLGRGDVGALENSAVRVVLAPDGALRSLINQQHPAQELAGEIDGLRLNDFCAHSDVGESFTTVVSGPVSVTLRAQSLAGVPHTTEVTLFRNSDRVEIRNEITVNFDDVRHWSFSFALSAPVVHTEEIGAINRDALQTNGGDYANAIARYDYVSVNHFADISEGAVGITLSNSDLAFAQLGRSTSQFLDTNTPQINFLAGGQVDGRSLGIPRQNGASSFLQRFALRAHDHYDPVEAMRFALEDQNPLVAAAVISDGPTGFYPETQYSLLTVEGRGVLLWALKPAEEGIDHGLIARLWNVTSAPAEAKLALSGGIISAELTTHIETNLSAVPLDQTGAAAATFAPQQIQTYRLESTPRKP